MVNTPPLCINMEIFDKGKFTTQNILVLKPCIILDFNSDYYIPEIGKLAFNLPHVYILGKNNCAGKCHCMFVSWHNKYDWKCTRNYAEIYQVLSEQVYSQYWSGCEYNSMGGVVLEKFKKFKPSNIPMSQFNSHLSD